MGRELRLGHRAPAQPGRPPHQRLQPHQEPGPRRRVSLPSNSAPHLTEDRIQVAGASRLVALKRQRLQCRHPNLRAVLMLMSSATQAPELFKLLIYKVIRTAIFVVGSRIFLFFSLLTDTCLA